MLESCSDFPITGRGMSCDVCINPEALDVRGPTLSFLRNQTCATPPAILTFDYSSCQCHYGSCWHSTEEANILVKYWCIPVGLYMICGFISTKQRPVVNPIRSVCGAPPKNIILFMPFQCSLMPRCDFGFLELDQDLSTSVSLLSLPPRTKSVSCHCS